MPWYQIKNILNHDISHYLKRIEVRSSVEVFRAKESNEAKRFRLLILAKSA